MFKKKKEEQKNTYEDNSTTKQIAFFGFYLVFFIVIIILLKTSYKPNNTNTTNTSSNGYGYDYKLTSLTNDNYHFIYKEDLNDGQTIYEGDVLNKVISFTKSGEVAQDYYVSQDKVYIKDNNLLTWSETENPIRFKDFMEPLNIQSIINNATYVYRTEYKTEDILNFGYTISNNELRQIFKIPEVEGDEEQNAVIVLTDKNGTIKSISFELTNYYKNIDSTINKYVLSFNYSKFNEIKEITNPIN